MFSLYSVGGYCNIKDLSFSNKHQKKATVEEMIALKDTKSYCRNGNECKRYKKRNVLEFRHNTGKIADD